MTTASDALSAMRSIAAGGEVAGAWNFVVQTYQRAGQQGASVVGPAIDQLSGGNPQTTTLTHRAWGNNGLLANINSGDSATKADADAAKRLCDSMIQDLQIALNLASANPHPMAAAAEHIAATNPNPYRATAPQYHVPYQSPPQYTPPQYTPPQYTPPQYVPPQQTPPQDVHESPESLARKAEMEKDLKRFAPAAAGAAGGFMMGGPPGAAIGGIVGLVVGLILTSDKK